jgi:hypothetical protein
VALQYIYIFIFLEERPMKKTVYCAALCIMQQAAYGVFNAVPGDQIWNMVNQIGRTNQAIKGYATFISNATLPLTITTPGRYAVVEPLNYTPGGVPITIASDDVYLTLNGYTLTVANNTAISIQVNAGLSNISIVDGGITGGLGVQFMGNHNGVTVQDIVLNNCGNTISFASLGINSGSSNIFINNVRQDGASTIVQGIGVTNSNNIQVTNCECNNNSTIGIVIENAQQVAVDNLITLNNGTLGLSIFQCSDTLVTNCSASSTHPATAISIFQSEHCILTNCASMGNQIGLSFSGTCSAISCKNFSSLQDFIGIDMSLSTSLTSLINIEDATIELARSVGLEISNGTNNVKLQNVDFISTGSTAILGATHTNLIFKNVNVIDVNVDAALTFDTLTNFLFKNSSCIARYPSTSIPNMMNFNSLTNAVFKNNTLMCNNLPNAAILINQQILNTCIVDCYQSLATYGLLVAAAAPNIGAEAVVISNCIFDDNSFAAISINTGRACAIRNCSINNSTASSNGIETSIIQSAITRNNINLDGTGIFLNGPYAENYVGFNSIVQGPDPANVGINEGIAVIRGNAFFGNMVQNTSPGGGVIISSSVYLYGTFFCNPASSQTLPQSHWENLHVVYN